MVYGARLESVLGASPHEFKSRILRHQPESLERQAFRLFVSRLPPRRAAQRTLLPVFAQHAIPAKHHQPHDAGNRRTTC